MPLTLSEFKIKNPAYKDVPDDILADKLHAKYYAAIPKDEFYRSIDYSPESMNQGDMSQESSGNKLKSFVSFLNDAPINAAITAGSLTQDALLGAIKSIVKAAKVVAPPPSQFDQFTSDESIDKFLDKFSSGYKDLPHSLAEGAGEYAVFAPFAGEKLLQQALVGGLASANSARENKLQAFGLGSVSNVLPVAVLKAFESGRPANFLKGVLSKEQLQENLETAKDTSTALGDVLESRGIKRLYENVISKLPFSGASARMEKTGAQVLQKADEITEDLYKNVSPFEANERMSEKLNSNYLKERKEKQRLYSDADKIARDNNITVSPDKFAKTAADYSEAIEDTNILKFEPSMRKAFSKLANYKKGSNKDASLSEANILKGIFGHYAKVYAKSPDADKRMLSGVFNELRKDLSADINKSIQKSGNEELKSAYDAAEKNYRENFSKYLDKNIYKFIGGNADKDMLATTFLKTGKTADRANLAGSLSEVLKKDSNLLTQSYFARAFDNEGKLNYGELARLVQKLGPKQLNAVVKNPSLRKNLQDYKKLYKMNTKAVNRVANPETGQQLADFLVPAISTLGSGLAGGLFEGTKNNDLASAIEGTAAGLVLPGLIARPLTNLLTNENTRNKLVGKIIEGKPKFATNAKQRSAQILLQALVNHLQNENAQGAQ